MTVGISRDFYGLSEEEQESGLDMSLIEHNPDNDLGAMMDDFSDIATNPPSLRNFLTSQRGWRALRLPGGRVAERGDLLNFMAQFVPGFKGDTLRDSPYRFLITAPMWNSYIRNMEPQDDALELNAPISEQEILSIRQFCEEWSDDKSHNDFVRRLINHPSVSVADAIQKGDLVYQIATRQLRLRTAHPNSNNPYPARLMMDILNSIPLKSYNFYSLNNLHLHEGPRIYGEFLNRYVPLSATEVAMVEEINTGVQGMGSSYANMTTNINGDITMAFTLMEQVLESYAIGDTKTVRLTLNMLLSPPYNFNSVASKINVSGVSGGQYLTKNSVVHLRFPKPDKGKVSQRDVFKDKGISMLTLKTYITQNGERKTLPDNATNAFAADRPAYFVTIDNSGMFVDDVLYMGPGNETTVRRVSEGEYNSALKQLVDRVGAGRAATPVTDTRNRPDRNRDEGRGRRSITGPRRNPGKRDIDSPIKASAEVISPVRSNFLKKKASLQPVPKTGAKEIAIIREDLYSSDMTKALAAEKYLGWLTVGFLGDAYAKKFFTDKTEEQTLFDVVSYASAYTFEGKKILPKRAEEVLQAFEAGGHKVGGQVLLLGQCIVASFGNTVLTAEMADKFEQKATEYYQKYRAKANPKGRFGAKSTMGDGKNIYVMFHNHKTRMEFRGKYKSRKSKTAHAHQLGTVRMSDPTGMADAFPSRQGKLNGYFLKVGLYKRTGTPEPFMASLPRTHFTATSKDVTINGEKKKIRTIKMLKGTEKQKKAWAKFKRFYGIPVFVGGGAGDTNTFKIHSKKQGSYYTKLRKKPSKK